MKLTNHELNVKELYSDIPFENFDESFVEFKQSLRSK